MNRAPSSIRLSCSILLTRGPLKCRAAFNRARRKVELNSFEKIKLLRNANFVFSALASVRSWIPQKVT